MNNAERSHTIKHIKVMNFLVFKGEFATDFCSGINIFIGTNGTGKTSLLRCMYLICQKFALEQNKSSFLVQELFEDFQIVPSVRHVQTFVELSVNNVKYRTDLSPFGKIKVSNLNPPEPTDKCCFDLERALYIPEKDILEHAKGLLTFIEQKQTGFSSIYKDALVSAMDVPTREQSEMQKSIGEKIVKIIGGTVQWDKSEGAFYTLRTDGSKIPFANEASGFKKFGYLGLLVATGQLGPGTILFWDEPENSLNPELMPELVNILLELQRNGVQIFIATHNAMLVNEFDVSRKNADQVMHHSLYKDDDGNVKITSDSRFDLLSPNKLTQASVEQYEREIERGLSGHD